ncbi:MAG: 30S ribosomal protein S1, partial [Acidobacteria bacterium]
NIVLSRKAVLEEENVEKKKRTLESLEEGKHMRGVVKNITDYGAFVDLGGIDGLLHITDMSWGRINHPSELFNVGDEIDVVVLKFDRERERVSLGYKQSQSDPWERAAERYPPYSRIRGKVVSLTDYGAFIELEPGIEGLIHVSEMSWTKRVKHPSKILNIGDMVEAVVLEIDQNARRLSLGLKQTEPNPWDVVDQKYRVGDRITGKVRNLTDFGAFVEVEEGIDGLIHISDLSWNKRVKHPSELVKKGDMVETVILKIDTENQRLSLGLKQLAPNAYDDFFAVHRVGEVLEGKVARLTDFGAFIELEEGVEGLAHVSEIARERIEKPEDRIHPDQPVKVKIIRLDPQEKKIGLSIRAVLEDEEADLLSGYGSSGEPGGASLAEISSANAPMEPEGTEPAKPRRKSKTSRSSSET